MARDPKEIEGRRNNDATACLVVERADVWLWIVSAFFFGMTLGMVAGGFV